ncbi:MAG TPA: hypothetical protein VND94_16085 [Terriglobia bacterium]|nr:hypothetical protein [Terriglobia bacterium]
MRQLTMVTLPVAAWILCSCTAPSQPDKSGLQQAEQAAKIAAEDEAMKKNAPMELVPSKPAVMPARSDKTKPLAVPSTVAIAAPVKAGNTSPASPGKADLIAAVKPIAAGPIAAEPMKTGPMEAGPGAAKPGAAKPVVAAAPASGDGGVAVATELPVNGTAIHLASYREIGSAQRGWQILTQHYRELLPLKPLYVAVDLPGKGHVLRLYGTDADATALQEICRTMHTDGAYCAANIAF